MVLEVSFDLHLSECSQHMDCFERNVNQAKNCWTMREWHNIGHNLILSALFNSPTPHLILKNNTQVIMLTQTPQIIVVATDHIPKDTEILTVPCSVLRTRDTVPRSIATRLPKDMTVHGLLAADLALGQTQSPAYKYSAWDAVVPSRDDIKRSMPLTWPASLQALLPPAARTLLDKQKTKFDKDWSLVSSAFPFPSSPSSSSSSPADYPPILPSCSREDYLHAWLLVNTRTFYFVTPSTERLPKEDHMALQPVADLFNHTDANGCHVAFDHDGSYSFRARRAYDKGDEVHISYGAHHNDFLLAEYGFVLPRATNTWDEVRLDDALLPRLPRRLQEDLEDVGFLGNYVLDGDTVCHRTQVALRLLVADRRGGYSVDEWRRFVSGLDDGERSQRGADEVLVTLLEDYGAVVDDKIEEVLGLKFDAASRDLNESRRELLLSRWEQIAHLLRQTIERLQ